MQPVRLLVEPVHPAKVWEEIRYGTLPFVVVIDIVMLAGFNILFVW